MEAKSFEKESLKERTVSDEEAIKTILSGALSIREENYAFLNGLKRDSLEYLYFTKDGYVAIYHVPFKGKELPIDFLTERVKVENGYLKRWDKKKKRFVRADVKRIQKPFFPFLIKRKIDGIKRKIAFNVAIANFGKEKIKKIKKVIYG